MAGKRREMSDYLDKWNEFIAEEDADRDTYGTEVEDRNKESLKQGAEEMGLEEAVAGKCRKGYITHKTQPTKKMYGDTYRNCVKAEGEEKELEEAMEYITPEEIAKLEDRYLEARKRLRRSKSAPLSDPKARNEAAQILQQLTKLSKRGKYNMNNLRKKMKAAKKRNMSESLEELALQILDEKRKKKKKKKKKKKAKKDDRCTRIAKRKYDVWPSAYASGAVVQCRRGKIWKGLNEEEEKGLEIKIRKALRDEGGAAGMDALVKHTKASEKEIKDAIKDMDDVGRHEDGDYILADGKKVDILKEAALDEKKKKRKKRKKKKAGSESSKEGSLRDWFGRKGAPGKKGGWVDCNTCRKDKKTGRKKCKPCGRQKGEKRAKYPSCRPTPGACGERGRGRSWGKKSAKKRNEVLDKMKITKEELDQIIFEETREVYYETFIFPYLTEASLDDGTPVCTACLYELLDEASCDCPHLVYEAEYRGRKVTLNKPTRGDVKKFKVYVKDPKTGNVKKVNFGDPNMRIKKSNPKRRKSFRARHNCDNPGPKTKARYWSCKKW
jgi:hypothetical protein